MPMLDLSDEDAELLELAKRIGGRSALDLNMRAKTLHDKLFASRKTRADYERLIKEEFPDTQTTADVAAPIVEPYVARITALEERIKADDEARQKAAEEAEQGDFNKRWDSVVRDYSMTEEGQEKLLSFMKQRKNADPEAAAALYFKQNPAEPAPVTPSSIAPQSWSKDLGLQLDKNDADSELLIRSPDNWADKEAAAVLTEIRRSAA